MPGKAGKKETLKIIRWSVVPSVFLIDRVLKIWVLQNLGEGAGVPVWKGIFHLTRVNNTGAAFGLWRHSSVFLAAIAALSAAAIVFFLIRGRRPAPAQFYGWSMVAGGALGNLYDRLHYGYVIDFLDFRVWPVFNAADAFICVGVAVILWNALYASRPS